VQVVIVQFGGAVFFTVALTLDQWLWSLLFGIGDLLYAQVGATLEFRLMWFKKNCVVAMKLKGYGTKSNAIFTLGVLAAYEIK